MSGRLTILALACALAGHADTLRLRNGTSLTGSYLGGSADEVQFLVHDAVRHFARSDVAEIAFASNSIAAEGAAAASGVEFGPDLAGEPFLRGVTGYIPLERAVARLSRSAGILGPGASVYRIPGARSSVRVRRDDRIVLIVRLPSGGDPRRFQLYGLQSRSDYRQTQPTAGGRPPALPVAVRLVGESVYEITPARTLNPGEYAISPTDSNESYCFGVDR